VACSRGDSTTACGFLTEGKNSPCRSGTGGGNGVTLEGRSIGALYHKIKSWRKGGVRKPVYVQRRRVGVLFHTISEVKEVNLINRGGGPGS